MEKLSHHYGESITVFLVVMVILNEVRKGYFRGIRLYFKSSSFSYNPLLLLVFVILFASVFFFDAQLLVLLQTFHDPLSDFLVNFGGFFGRDLNLYFILTGCYLLALIVKRKNWSKIIFGALLTSILTALGSHILKVTFLRARPYGNLGPYSFFHLSGLTKMKSLFQSLPSGDVAIVAGATSYLFCTLKNRYSRWLIFLTPFSTAFSRVSLNRHWPSDTLLSIGVSLMMACLVWGYERKAHELA